MPEEVQATPAGPGAPPAGPARPGAAPAAPAGPGRAPAGPATGVVIVDKPAGWTSHDVVARCRKVFGQRRVGHAGTLDPDATGLLLVGVGRATRLLRFLTALRKTYRGEIVLGVATATLDASGEVVGTWDMSGVDLAAARAAAAELTGEILQVPPMVSAVKVGGRPLHQLARQGLEVARAPRPVTVHRFVVEAGDAPGTLAIEVECSSGTYVRVLAADLGEALGGGAHLRGLRRTRVGSFTEADACSLDAVSPSALRRPAEALRDLARVTVDDYVAAQVAQGRPLDLPASARGEQGPWTVVDGRGELLAVYEAADAGRAKAAVVLPCPL